jgi:hypothetical protein
MVGAQVEVAEVERSVAATLERLCQTPPNAPHRQGRLDRRPWRAQASVAREAGDGFKGQGDDRGRLRLREGRRI